jgi:ornithine carbamoyltransferase
MITFNKKKTAQPKPEIDKHYKSDFKHLLRIRDLTPQELSSLVLDAYKIKMANSKKIATTMTVGKKAVSFFSKSSSRTKSSWEVACSNLGIFSSFNNATDSQLGNKESIADSAKVFSQYYDIAG